VPEVALPAALLILSLVWGAWREARSDNPRDAKLLAAFGVAGALASAGLWLA
jgi:hypothetical protein